MAAPSGPASVDDCWLRLTADAANAPARLHASAVAKYSAMADTPGRNKKLIRKAPHLKKYNLKKNNKGRWCWSAKVWLPTGALSPLLDNLPAGALQAYWYKDPQLAGEYMLYLNWACLLHHNTLKKVLRKEGLEVLYIRGITVADLKRSSADPTWEKLERVPLI